MRRKDLIREVDKRIKQRRGGIYNFLMRLLNCGNNMIGLYDRDLPGGTEAFKEAIDYVVAQLKQHPDGLDVAIVCDGLRSLSESHAKWQREMCLSVIRSDTRLQIRAPGIVRLSGLKNPRIHTPKPT
jgi:hypothetical protein